MRCIREVNAHPEEWAFRGGGPIPRQHPDVIRSPLICAGASGDNESMATTDVNAAINVRLALLGLPIADDSAGSAEARLVAPLLARQRELSRRLTDRLCPADERIQSFLDSYFEGTGVRPRLPRQTLVLDQPGLARGLSLPVAADTYTSPMVSSYRLVNGVLHNPFNDRRTTAGVFHIAEGGLPIPDEKLAVPREVAARLFELAMQPPAEHMLLPYTADTDARAQSRPNHGSEIHHPRRVGLQSRLRRGHLRQRR